MDIEASGPIPGEYSLLSIGACVALESAETFYVELRPLNMNATDEAMGVCNLSLEELTKTGVEPRAAMERFAAWVERVAGNGRAIFVGFNAAFDWSFVNYYFIRFLEKNPFGHAALDVKSYYMGHAHTTYSGTNMRKIQEKFLMENLPLTHNALEDAVRQAALFKKMLGDSA